MLWVGIDTHLRMHRIEIQNDRGDAMWRGQINNDRPGFVKLLERLRLIQESNSQTIGSVFMNPTGNYHAPLKAYLESQGYRVILVDARVSEHIRMTQNLGKEKSDGADASILAATGRLKPSILETGNHERDPLSGMTRLMESISKNIRRTTNQIKADIAAVFPEYPLYESLCSRTSMEILDRYATPEAIRNSSMDDLLATMKSASKNHFKKEDAERLMKLAVDSIGIPDLEGIYAYRIRINVARLREEMKSLQRIRDDIESGLGENKDVENISAIGGMSMVLAATIVSEIGNITQFQSAVKLQSYGGKAPNITGSGGKVAATGVSKIRNPHLSNAVHESAVSLVMHRTPEFMEIFNREIRKGKKPTQAYIIVGKRLLYHVFSIMKNQKPYRERRPRGGEGSVSSGTTV